MCSDQSSFPLFVFSFHSLSLSLSLSNGGFPFLLSLVIFNCCLGSVRWKMLMSFNCRNRLLLTGTPIQNTMAEVKIFPVGPCHRYMSHCVISFFLTQLWALLHFIMPTMFDSHEEFNEWFSRDIESHAEKKSALDESKCPGLQLHTKEKNSFCSLSRSTFSTTHDPQAVHVEEDQEGC